MAAGVGNVAAGVFRGQPVGGSVGQTALNLQAGARTRWASILSGVWMILILIAFSGVVGYVAMPTLAAVLVFAAIRSLRVTDLGAIMRTGATSQVALVTTFLCTLLLPIAAAVGIGVAISLLLQVDREARDLAIVELEPTPEGDFVERPAPAQLPSDHVTLLGVYGSLYYAGARTLQADLPDPAGAHRPVVVLRLRGRIALGATAFVVLADYARRLAQVEGRLYLSGVDPDLLEQFRRNRRVPVEGPVKVFVAEPTLRVSTAHALADAEAWLVGHEPPPAS
jgi:SulP family sulfate permease